MRVPTLRCGSVHGKQKSRYSFDIGVQLQAAVSQIGNLSTNIGMLMYFVDLQ